MAKEVSMWDDLDGGSADETVPFSLDGKAYELDLSGANAAAFRRMLGPYIKQARPAQFNPAGIVLYLPAGQLRDVDQLGLMPLQELAVAATAGTNHPTGFLPTPQHQQQRPVLQVHTNPHVPQQSADSATPDTLAASARQPQQPTITATDPQVRAWAKIWSVPCPARGRVPLATHEVYTAFLAGNKGPWKSVLKKAGVRIKDAEKLAEERLAANEAAAAEPTAEELDAKHAQQIRTLTNAQLDRLRTMFNAADGRAKSSGLSSDNSSFEALAARHLCTKVEQEDRVATYEITNAGRLWFKVRGIPTRAESD